MSKKRWAIVLVCMVVYTLVVSGVCWAMYRDRSCIEVEMILDNTKDRTDIKGYTLHVTLVKWHDIYCKAD